jgi:hypothetical protein
MLGRIAFSIAILLLASCATSRAPTAGSNEARAATIPGEPSPSVSPPRPGLDHKLVVGYQGWFGCPGDFEDNKSWWHWFLNDDRASELLVDQLPDVSAFAQSDLCPTALRRADGSQVFLFSSQNPRVVNMHFRWMQMHGIETVAVQRFVVHLTDPQHNRRVDNLLDHIRAAAEATGRSFYVNYDVSGANETTVEDDIRRDWHYLARTMKVLDSPNYLNDSGKPVVQFWGFGFTDRPGTAQRTQQLISELKTGQRSLRAATVVGGVPAQWRTLDGDAKREPEWRNTYLTFDVISPWSVGRFASENGVTRFVHDRINQDLTLTRHENVRYMPVIFPGFSWLNLMTQYGKLGRKTNAVELNHIPRRCGNFMWKQAKSFADSGATMMYVSMFDEVDEGTAIFPTESRREALPHDAKMLYLNYDGCDLPGDWYLRLTGTLAEFMRTQRTIPSTLDKASPSN